MFVFVCTGCGADLTAPLSQVELPVHAHQSYGNGLQLPVLMEPGTFAVEPEPWGPPWRRWEDTDPDEAEARGIYAPVGVLSDGAPGAIAVAPGDVRGTRLLPELRGGACCGIAGGDGPNMVCTACGLPVATRIDDCSLWQTVWLAPDAVHRLPVDNAVPLSWEELTAEREGTPPFGPMARWGASHEPYRYWLWSPVWEAAAGRALAHLLVASQGDPVSVPDGLAGEVFQRTLDTLLPAGPPARRAVLAGPGQRASDPAADILLVPTHPQTGELWAPEGPSAAAYLVPLPLGIWLRLAFPAPHLPLPVLGNMPADVLRDDPIVPRPRSLFAADGRSFQETLARLPAARSPWLREILDSLTQKWHGRVFFQ
ncbi:hypothetical protein [Streptomyces sp. NPDC050738]|uniref:hypothetical protein n=1 Tax=Streptomyces sp. NPDC050738 TaxID=3154744 RepID=UPI00341D3988